MGIAVIIRGVSFLKKQSHPIWPNLAGLWRKCDTALIGGGVVVDFFSRRGCRVFIVHHHERGYAWPGLWNNSYRWPCFQPEIAASGVLKSVRYRPVLPLLGRGKSIVDVAYGMNGRTSIDSIQERNATTAWCITCHSARRTRGKTFEMRMGRTARVTLALLASALLLLLLSPVDAAGTRGGTDAHERVETAIKQTSDGSLRPERSGVYYPDTSLGGCRTSQSDEKSSGARRGRQSQLTSAFGDLASCCLENFGGLEGCVRASLELSKTGGKPTRPGTSSERRLGKSGKSHGKASGKASNNNWNWWSPPKKPAPKTWWSQPAAKKQAPAKPVLKKVAPKNQAAQSSWWTKSGKAKSSKAKSGKAKGRLKKKLQNKVIQARTYRPTRQPTRRPVGPDVLPDEDAIEITMGGTLTTSNLEWPPGTSLADVARAFEETIKRTLDDGSFVCDVYSIGGAVVPGSGLANKRGVVGVFERDLGSRRDLQSATSMVEFNLRTVKPCRGCNDMEALVLGAGTFDATFDHLGSKAADGSMSVTYCAIGEVGGVVKDPCRVEITSADGTSLDVEFVGEKPGELVFSCSFGFA